MSPLEKIFNIERKLSAVVNDRIDDFIEHAADEERDFMAALVREQMREGIDGTGLSIIPKYSRKTVEIKRKKGQVFDRVTLRDEGDFHRGEIAAKSGKAYILYSTDSKNDDLVFKYGEDIHKLTDENLSKVSHALLPSLIEQTFNFFNS
jgi:hypothetical protein